MIVKKIIYDWWYTNEGGEEYGVAEVGKEDVIKIEEHESKGIGDKLYYDIFFNTGKKIRIFNVSSVEYDNR